MYAASQKIQKNKTTYTTVKNEFVTLTMLAM